MADLSTKYLGITLRNPIIAGSSGLTSNPESIKNLERNGVGAVVLKSLFEEQIVLDTENQLRQAQKSSMIYDERSESLDYLDYHIKDNYVSKYLELINQVKNQTTLPVIGSINCTTSGEWTSFAKRIEEAGADALELNIAILNTNPDKPSVEIDNVYVNVVKNITSKINIPVTVKLSPYFCNMAQLVSRIEQAGAHGAVLFNRFFSPDIDLENMNISSANIYSTPNEFSNTLRWVSILSGKSGLDLVGSTGIHDGQTAVKLLLSGAKAVQVVSTVYKNGFDVIPKILHDIEYWMERNGYNYLDQLIGEMNQYKAKDPSSFERIQFMRYYSGIGNV